MFTFLGCGGAGKTTKIAEYTLWENMMDISTFVQNALHAEQQGIPVAWKDVAVTVTNVAVQRVGELEKQVAELTPSEEPDPLDPES